MDFVFDSQQGNLQKVVPGIVQGKVAEASFAYIFPDSAEDGDPKGCSLIHTILTIAIGVVKSLNWSSTAFNHTPEDGAPATPRSRASNLVTTPNGKRPRVSPFAIALKTKELPPDPHNHSDGTIDDEDLRPPPPAKRNNAKGGAGKKT
jgi:hypothetical protein